MFGLSVWELLVVFLIVLLVFGAKRLPEIGGSLGKGIREFKDSLTQVGEDVRGELEGTPDSREDAGESGSRNQAGGG